MLDKRQDWYRKQCALFSVRLGEWLDDNPGRMTKARKAILKAHDELARNFKDDNEAYLALVDVDDMAFEAPRSAGRVILKAMRPSESYNKWIVNNWSIGGQR